MFCNLLVLLSILFLRVLLLHPFLLPASIALPAADNGFICSPARPEGGVSRHTRRVSEEPRGEDPAGKLRFRMFSGAVRQLTPEPHTPAVRGVLTGPRLPSPSNLARPFRFRQLDGREIGFPCYRGGWAGLRVLSTVHAASKKFLFTLLLIVLTLSFCPLTDL